MGRWREATALTRWPAAPPAIRCERRPRRRRSAKQPPTSFQHITVARAETERRLRERRERFASVDVDDDATVVLTGSWGRREITSESDDDFMVLV